MSAETTISLPDEGLLKYLLERLPKPDDKEGLERVAKGADVPFHTLLKVVKGETVDPRVSTFERLVRYLGECEAA